jgi:glycerate 2-kinase
VRKLKIVIAPQAFKGSASASDVATAIAQGIHRVFPNALLSIVPVADGGDGTLDVLIQAIGGRIHHIRTINAFGDEIDAPWGVTCDGKTAIIELAQICGIAMLPSQKRNPIVTTTYGVGEVIQAALDQNIRQFFIGLGGSATNDAGTGLVKALGVRFLDAKGQDLPSGGGALADLQRIDVSGLDPRIHEAQIFAGCDVVNPLLGPTGASLVYSAQKGATSAMSIQLEKALTHFAEIVKRDLGYEIGNLWSGGAAGGTGAALSLFLSATLGLGIDWILDKIGFSRFLDGVDLVITGEGRFDVQTGYHKAPLGVAKRAKALDIPIMAITGSVGKGFIHEYQQEIDAVIPIAFTSIKPPQNTLNLIALATEEAMRCLKIGRGRSDKK